MLAASMCRGELHFTVLPSTLGSTVPRCLFGPPNAKETVDLLHEALEMERSKFARRWGVDPRSEDKENFAKSKNEKAEKSPRKRSSPYSRQSSIHEFWRSRKNYDVGAKRSAVAVSSAETTKQTINSIEKPTTSSSTSSSSSS